MKSRELRAKFIQFFRGHGHTVVPSSPVIPHNDPTLLFVNAGMNQFKEVFLGETFLDYTRAASSQKCVRVGGKHNDLDNVGHTTRHLTLFEMLGNFSFGDYFKKEAIDFAWNLTTHVIGLPVEKLWVSVFIDDDESFELWKRHIKEERISRIPGKSNFWEMGDTGPCGPCTELFYDKGEKYGKARNPLEDCDEGERFFEFWNLVFMQFNRDSNGQTHPLPKPCVDTGMGLERMVSLLQGVETVFQTDILARLIRETEKLSGKKYESNKSAFHVVADHIRSLSICIADGAQPSNVDRGYVLRKLLRRAVRYGRKLDFQEPFLAKLLPPLIEEMGDDYPELVSAKEKIGELLTLEEENFLRTLKRGGNILNTIMEKSEKLQRKEISGEDAFKLKDTYGFPLEEIMLLAKDHHLNVNLEEYQLLEEKARELSKKAHKDHSQVAKESVFAEFTQTHPPTNFLGYEHLELNGSIIGIMKDGEFQEKLSAGEEGILILDQTSFYAEKGGQIGDQGKISHHSAHFTVTDCQNPYPGVIIHQGKVDTGVFIMGEPVHTSVDEERRKKIRQSHSANHLLNWALTKVLGPSVKQAGSFVGPETLRLDFSHHKAVTREELREIESVIATMIRENHPVNTYETSYEQVKKRGDIKQFFGDKYGDVVRVVNIDEFSKELCGGTHVRSLSEIGSFCITKESSVSAGVRRIEAVTGKLAQDFIYEREDLLLDMCDSLETSPLKLRERISSLLEEIKESKTQLRAMRKLHVKAVLEELMSKVEKNDDTSFICATVELTKDEFSPLANDLFHRMGPGVLVLGMKADDRVSLLVKVSPDLVAKGIHANKIIQEISPEIDGSGGGKTDTAQAGGKNPNGLERAYEKAKQFLRK